MRDIFSAVVLETLLLDLDYEITHSGYFGRSDYGPSRNHSGRGFARSPLAGRKGLAMV